MTIVSSFVFEDFREGQAFAFDHALTAADIDAFAAATGDVSPLHMDEVFARERGYGGRVAHGLLLAGFVSRLIGVHFPGKNCLLHSASFSFPSPACAGDLLTVSASVSQLSQASKVMVLQVAVLVKGSGATAARGKVQLGFTG